MTASDLLDELHAFFMGLLAAHEELQSAAAIEFDKARATAAAIPAKPDDGLREAAQRLCDAIADKAAIDGLIRDGVSKDWQQQMDADGAYIDALKATRTALDGRPR